MVITAESWMYDPEHTSFGIGHTTLWQTTVEMTSVIKKWISDMKT